MLLRNETKASPKTKIIPLRIQSPDDNAVDPFAARDAVISEQIVVILKDMLQALRTPSGK